MSDVDFNLTGSEKMIQAMALCGLCRQIYFPEEILSDLGQSLEDDPANQNFNSDIRNIGDFFIPSLFSTLRNAGALLSVTGDPIK